MKYICNNCDKVIQEHDVTIHYKETPNGQRIFAICQLCLDDYLKKTKVDTNRKADENERMRMKRKW
jgi:hypothetical protein